ncbi:hypothetical protein [Fusobacterium hominis]|uniref:hypothetical protein n=1 Tax=Fusobacterium hominis TaxID=2764326 RepID=UPI0022E4AE00|nr:hypothetical protein [Fusobacterium hominis]
MNQLYFKRIIEKINYNFIPVYYTKDNSIMGYKIIKDFSPVGFNDKDFMYQMAFEEGVFEEFILELLEKAYKIAKEKNLDKFYLFYTLRMNYITDIKEFFNKIKHIIDDLNLKHDNVIFDIKHIKNWYSFYQKIENSYHYKTILKENRNERFNIVAIEDAKPDILEFRVIKHYLELKDSLPNTTKLAFNLAHNHGTTVKDLRNMNIDFYYTYK